MQIPPIDLFNWLLTNSEKASYNLALSNISGLSWEEYHHLTGVMIPKKGDLGENSHYGARALKDTLCSVYDCTPENIVTTTGATEANFLVFSSLLNQGDDFIIEQPGYQPLWLTPEMLGAHRINWVRAFENHYRLDLDLLIKILTSKTKMIVITNLHNPSGVLADRRTIETVAEIARKHHVYVLIDEIFLDGSFIPTKSSFGIPNVIITSSMTKIYGLGGFHTGWIVAPKEIIETCQRMKAHTTAAASYVSEIMSANILKNARNDLMTRFQKRAKNNHLLLKKWMNNQKDLLTWVEPDGGIICFPKYTMKLSSLELCMHLLQHQNVLVNPGVYFNQEGHIRVAYGNDTETLQKGLKALEEGLQNIIVNKL